MSDFDYDGLKSEGGFKRKYETLLKENEELFHQFHRCYKYILHEEIQYAYIQDNVSLFMCVIIYHVIFGDCATNAVNHSLAALIASKTAHRVFNSRIFRINEAYNGFFAG